MEQNYIAKVNKLDIKNAVESKLKCLVLIVLVSLGSSQLALSSIEDSLCFEDCPISVSIQDYNCFITGMSLDAIVSGGSSEYSYLWNGPNGFSSSNQSISVLELGVFSVIVTDVLGCTASESITIEEAFDIQINEINTNICQGQSIELSVDYKNGYSYDWGGNVNMQYSNLIVVTPHESATSYSVTVTSPDGCFAADTITFNLFDCIGQTCFNGESEVTATSDWKIFYEVDSINDFIRIRSQLSSNFVDNSYGINRIGWNKHDFNDLVSSDHLILSLFEVGGTKSMEIKMDYLTASTEATSGYASLGVEGGDGSVILGDPSNVLNVITSLDVNLNEYGYELFVNSPATDEDYTPNPLYPLWIFDVWYEVDVKLSSFGAQGFGNVLINSVHASPAKTPNSTIIVTEGPCCELDVEISGDELTCLEDSIDLNVNSTSIVSKKIYPEIDTYLGENKHESNFSNCDKLYVGTKDGQLERPLLKFDLSDIPLGADILSASYYAIKPDAASNSSNLNDISLHRVLSSWSGIGGVCNGKDKYPVNWDERLASTSWNTPGGDFDSMSEATIPVSSSGTYVWDLTSLVEDWLDGTYANHGFILRQETGDANQKYFWSNDKKDEETYLEIQYIKDEDGTDFTYEWDYQSNSDQDITVNLEVSTTFIVTVTEIGGCSGIDSLYVEVDSVSQITISGLDTICSGSPVELTSNGIDSDLSYSWSTGQNDSTITVSPLVSTEYKLTATNSNGCSNYGQFLVYVDTFVFLEALDICTEDFLQLQMFSNGMWISSDTSVAYIDNMGVVYGVSEGVAALSFYNEETGCNLSTGTISVSPRPEIELLGPSIICGGETTNVTSNLDGVWMSSDTAIATITDDGLVMAISEGDVSLIFISNETICTSVSSIDITISEKPIITNISSTVLCVGEVSNISTSSSDGSWYSSNELVAIISNEGIIVGISEGTASFTYESSLGCASDASGSITVNPELNLGIEYLGSACLEENSQLVAVVIGGSAGLMYDWTGPDEFISDQQTIDVLLSGLYNVTVTDGAGCSKDQSALVYEAYEPFFLGIDTEICEGEDVLLTVNSSIESSYLWSVNAASAIANTVTVTPNAPGELYHVTVTNSLGCSNVLSAEIDVKPTPNVSITGEDNICLGSSTTLSPSSGGVWVSSNYSTASVSDTGLVIGLGPGEAIFTFQDTSTSCYSSPTLPIIVNNNFDIILTGNNQYCIGELQSLVSSETEGSWSSSNTAIAEVDVNGTITPLTVGNVDITFIPPSNTCFNQGFKTITVNPIPITNVNGPSIICQNDITYLVPSSGGSWASSDSLVAKVSNNGVVTGVSGGSASFTFTSSGGCIQGIATLIEVVQISNVGISGPDSICIGDQTNLSPTQGGVWISSNSSVASVNNSGVVTGISQGEAMFTYIDILNGCASTEFLKVTVNPIPQITGIADQELCINETTNISPTIGGYWISSNNSVASISDSGEIMGVASGQASFIFIDAITGCESSPSSIITVQEKPIIDIIGPTELCLGESSFILPNTGGYWSTSDVSIATITLEGEILAVSQGEVSFVFTDNITGCKSDSSTIFNVNNPTPPVIIVPGELCVGDTDSLTSMVSGNWLSSNEVIATVSSSGLLTGVTSGSVSITFIPSGYCMANVTTEVIIVSNPTLEFTGPESICIGSTTTLSPTSGGVWTSSDTMVAVVDSFGEITGISEGSALFTYQSYASGCITTLGSSVEIFDYPLVNIIGSDSICIGDHTMLTPSEGGSWTSSNSNIAIINSDGLVTGLNPGTVTFKFVEYGSNCFSDDSETVTILPKPIVNIDGDNTICVGITTSLSPVTGGVWISNNSNIATVSQQGVVLGISGGVVKFTFVSDAGCASNETSPIIVFDKPSIALIGSSDICIGESVQVLPSSGGTWISNDTSVALISNSGLVSGISPGTVSFTFTDNISSCISDDSELITVTEVPLIELGGPSGICIGGSAIFTASSVGVWISINPSVASIQNNGEVFGLSTGEARFIFMSLETGCFADTSSTIIVDSGQEIDFTGPTELCIGSTSMLSPSSEGTWESTDTTIATITDTGIVLAINSGTVKFRYTDSSTGCKSGFSEDLVVQVPPEALLVGSSAICIGNTTHFSSSSSGVWTSMDSLVATIDQNGVVTALNDGLANFRFTDTETGCDADDEMEVLVHALNEISIVGEDIICLGYTTILTTSENGFWSSSNSEIASISNSGVVTGKAPGIVTFEFVNISTGCLAMNPSDPITVEPCLNPDFNVSFVGLDISGNLNTNDHIQVDHEYGSMPILISKPSASQYLLQIDSSGTYIFNANKKGKYVFKVPICIFPQTFGCPSSILELNVVEKENSSSYPVSNLEFGTVFSNNSSNGNKQSNVSVIINELANDRCLFEDECTLDVNLINFIKAPSNGLINIDTSGSFLYIPFDGFVGLDTLEYEVCVEGSAGLNCSNSRLIITVNDPSAVNSIIAVDDFEWGYKEALITGNVMLNDSDPELNTIAVIPQGDIDSPIVFASGEYFIESNGDFSFTPNESFFGSTDITYTLCDDAEEPSCTDATLHVLVQDDISISLRVYIEGALMQNDGAVSSSGLPLMRDDLRESPYTGQNYIPLHDPYSVSADLYTDITNKYNTLGPGMLDKNKVIVNPSLVFGVEGENAIVDWVHVELRTKNDMTMPFATRSGLLQRDGDIVDLDGISDLRFNGVFTDSVYVVVKHRSHLGVMSLLVSSGDNMDFTSPDFPVFDFGTSLGEDFDYTNLARNNNLMSGYSALWAGDFDSNGKIKFTNPADDQNVLFIDVLFSSPDFLINYDSGYGYLTADFNMDGKVKYTNPLDDLNHLFGQILLYPLNTSFFSNYNSIIEQVPNE